jgi:hypothetical protein
MDDQRVAGPNMQLSRQTMDVIAKDMAKALAQVGEHHGMRFRLGEISFTNQNFTAKIEGVVLGGQDADAQRYDQEKLLMNLPPLNAVFRMGPAEYTPLGLKSRGKNRVILKRQSDNAIVLAPITMVARTVGPIMDFPEYKKQVEDLFCVSDDRIEAHLRHFYESGFTPGHAVMHLRGL